MSYRSNEEWVTVNQQLASVETLVPTTEITTAYLNADLAERLQFDTTFEKQALQRTKLLEMFLSFSRAANEAKTADEAMQAALTHIANYNDWMIGHAWRLAGDDSGQLESSKLWYTRDAFHWRSAHLQRFRRLMQRIRISPGEGLVGSVLKRARPQWLSDLKGCAEAKIFCNLDVQSVIAFPVTFEGSVVAVMEFLSDKVTRPAESLLEIVPDIGTQLGHVIARHRVDRIIAEVAIAEQQRIGRELHDGIAQQLTGGALIAESLRRSLPASSTPRYDGLMHLTEILKQVHRDVRRLSHGLLMTEIRAADLLPAIRNLAKETTDRHQLRCEVRHSQFQEAFVNVDFVAFVILQIVREAVHNAVKHAHAREILIELASDTSFRMSVSDDGIGIGVAHYAAGSSHGLRIMHHRAQSIRGELITELIDSGGTRVRLTIPKRSCQT